MLRRLLEAEAELLLREAWRGGLDLIGRGLKVEQLALLYRIRLLQLQVCRILGSELRLELRAESEHYSVFVPEDWGAYVSEMSRDSAWGDHITLQAAADAELYRAKKEAEANKLFVVPPENVRLKLSPKSVPEAQAAFLDRFNKIMTEIGAP